MKRILLLAQTVLLCLPAAAGISSEPSLLDPAASSAAIVRRGRAGLVLLARSDVRKELDLIESQERSIAQLIRGLNSRIIRLMLQIHELSEPERRERINRFQLELQNDIEEILLPHQVNRLRQITFQYRIDTADIAAAFTTAEVVEALEITEKQLASLRASRFEVEKTYRERLMVIREEAAKRMQAHLTSAQRAKWKELVGPLFIEDPSIAEDVMDELLRD